MKAYAAIAAVLMLAGCASTQKVLDKAPTEVFHSQKSQNEVAFCLANKNNTSAMDRDDGSKVVLIKNGYGGVSLAFSVFAEGTGSRVEYRKEFGTIGGIWKQCIGIKDEK
jgi:outer membrane murein-binding lipoprotein Lpp